MRPNNKVDCPLDKKKIEGLDLNKNQRQNFFDLILVTQYLYFQNPSSSYFLGKERCEGQWPSCAILNGMHSCVRLFILEI